MARLLAQSLARPSPATAASLLPLRGLSTKVELIEIDLAEEDPSSVEVVGIRRMEEAIHGVMVRRATPEWLPFVPGGSFWCPVRRPAGSLSSSAGSRRPGSARWPTRRSPTSP
ncbi:hypothetical protein ZWY2020_018146 [Hordeum vulgare]|nr:hypothetical protein ZWY2020_018146 [Hordeum vulgare]